MSARLHFEPVIAELHNAGWTVVRLGDVRIGVLRPVGRSRVVFEADSSHPIASATLRNIADMVDRLSGERIKQERARPMKTYLVWLCTLSQDARIRREKNPIGSVMALSAADARRKARRAFHFKSNQFAQVRCDSIRAQRIANEVAIASSCGVSLSFADAYRFVCRTRKRGERFNSTKAQRAERYCAVTMSAHGNGAV